MHKSLHCPYVRCGKVFEKPLVLTDMSKMPRETYYACPYCLSKVEIVVEDERSLNSISVETSDNPEEMPPLECPHHFGYLKNLPEKASIPDECLTCPKLIQCFIKKWKADRTLFARPYPNCFTANRYSHASFLRLSDLI